jgi:hypothetical protein
VRWSLQVLRAVQLVSLVAAVLGATEHARADETHYQNVFIGDRAFGMGGASTGLAADTSGTFYNPGALAELPNRSFSASLGLTAFERTRVLGGVRGPDSVADLRQSASRSLPVFSAALLRFGRHGPDGLKRHAVAFSTLYPASVDLALRVDLLHPMTGIPSTVRVDHTYRQTLYGVSYALHLSHKVAFGITAYLATQRLMHSETLFIASGGVPAPGGGFTDVESYAGLTRIVARSYSLLPRVGFFYRPNAKVSLGITLQPPALTVRTRASLDQQSASSVIDPMTGQTITTFELVEQRGLRVRMPIPWMVRAGIGYHATNSLTLAFDVTLHGAIGARRILPGANEEALARTPFMPVDTRRMATLDAALGAEWVMRDGVTWRVGVFTNRSAAPRIPDTTSRVPPRAGAPLRGILRARCPRGRLPLDDGARWVARARLGAVGRHQPQQHRDLRPDPRGRARALRVHHRRHALGGAAGPERAASRAEPKRRWSGRRRRPP